MEFLQYSIYLFLIFVQLFRIIRGQSVGTPTSPTVCDGRTTTLTCDISQSNGEAPLWRVFTTSDTSGSPVASLAIGENSPPYNYPAVQPGDTVARLEVNASSSISGYHFQCRLLLAPPVDSPGTGTITVITEPPSCPTSFSANRDSGFTSATVTWQQPPNPPPVTSTTVTYCPTSSPNCGNSMNCTTSPCTISGLDPCVEYNLSAIPTNNCGSPTGCTSMIVASQDVSSCPTGVQVENVDSINCFVLLTCQQPPNTPPVTSTTVTYCPTSSPNCGNIMTCTSPCTISGLDPGTEYQFTVIPNNNCGSPTGCTGNTANVTTLDSCTSTTASPLSTTSSVGAIAVGVIGGLIGIAIASLATYAIGVLIAVLCCSSCEGRSYCHVFFCQYCCGGESERSSSTRPLPTTDYVDPKQVREKKEKEDKIEYAALEFSERAGGSEGNTIRSKEEPVQYLTVGQA